MPRVPTHQQVARPTGFVVLGLAAGMLFCAFVGALFSYLGHHRPGLDDNSVLEMLVSAAITTAIGAVLIRVGAPAAHEQMRRKEATITTSVIWILTGICGALPFMIDTHMSFPAAFFEAVSGFTTTGATVIGDIEGSLSRPVLLWRSLIQWLGGMGIVVLFIAIFPSLGVSGKHMFRTEVPGHSAEGLKPKITETSWILWKLYAIFTFVQIGIMFVLLMWWVPATAHTHWSENLFDAVCHSFTTLSTGGFSTKNASIGYFDSALIDYTVSLFMLAAGMNFSLYYAALLSRPRPDDEQRSLFQRARRWFNSITYVFRHSIEFRAYVLIVVVATILLSIAILPNHGSLIHSLRYAFFMVATTMTSTGFGTDNYMAYPSNGLGLILGMMLIGGMSGSTAGGIKVSRVVLLGENTWAMLRKSIRPQVVHVSRLGKEIISEDTLHAVSTFFFLFMFSLGVGSLAITYTDGVPVPTAFGAMLSSLSNMGPAPFYTEADNFGGYSPTAKVIFSVAMILGRLEFFTVFALLLPELWRNK